MQVTILKKIEMSEHFTYKKLLLYSLPSIGNMLVLTSFQVVDGFFVSNLLGVDQLESVNLIYPIFMVLQAVGYMFGAGSSAHVAQTLGEGKKEKAREYFTMAVTAMIITGVVLGLICVPLMPALARLVGASGGILTNSVAYGRMLMFFLPFFLINCAFQTLWITAGKPALGLGISAIYGIGNAFLDWLMMYVFHLGITGAALATSIAATVSALFTLIYFFRENPTPLKFSTVSRDSLKHLGNEMANGASEMVEGIAGNFTAILTNRQLLRYVGDLGVVANGIFNYVLAVFMAVFFGISTTTVSVAGYKYGQKDKKELNSLLKTNIRLNFTIGAIMTVTAILLAKPLAMIFVGYHQDALELTTTVLRISSFACLFYGFDIVTSSFFTGLGDGVTSALVAVCMALVTPIASIYLLPLCFGAQAIWFSAPCSTAVTAAFCAVCIWKRYPRKIAAL